jgi:hypothetical protein
LVPNAGLVRHQTTLVVDLSQVKPAEDEKRWWKKSGKVQPAKLRFIIEAVIGVAEVSFRCRKWTWSDLHPAAILTCGTTVDPATERPISKSVDLKVNCEEHVAPPPKKELPVRESSSSS